MRNQQKFIVSIHANVSKVEEDQRRAKKNEEVVKNIERARRRREEEEQKYNKGSQFLFSNSAVI